MRILPVPIAGPVVFEAPVHRDSRGFFMETWRDAWREELGIPRPFVQDNHARSEERGVLRGLHYQKPPHAQGKLVWVTRGAVFDVAVDLRPGSPSFGSWHGLVLSAENALRFYVPRGFAHGYLTLSPGTEFMYKVDAYYAPEAEGGLRWNDPELAIAWPEAPAVLAARDAGLPLLADSGSPFSCDGEFAQQG